MTIFLKIALVAIGVGMAAWLAVIAHDLGTDFRRFTKPAGSAERRLRTATSRRADVSHSATDRAAGVV